MLVNAFIEGEEPVGCTQKNNQTFSPTPELVGFKWKRLYTLVYECLTDWLKKIVYECLTDGLKCGLYGLGLTNFII